MVWGNTTIGIDESAVSTARFRESDRERRRRTLPSDHPSHISLAHPSKIPSTLLKNPLANPAVFPSPSLFLSLSLSL